MKFRVEIFGQDVLLSVKQLDALVKLIEGSEIVGQEHVGEGNGNTGWKDAYIQVIGKVDMDCIKPKVVTDDAYNSMVAVTKMRQQNN